MQLKVLAKKQENNRICYFCSSSLKEYILGLPEDYMDYNIQRGIRSNVYLKRLIETVLNKRHIPPIVLVEKNPEIGQNVLELTNFKILDGLQRTYRLKAIWGIYDFFNEKIKDDIEEVSKYSKYALSRRFGKDLKEYGEEINEIHSPTNVLRKIIKFYEDNGAQKLEECFSDNEQWFEVWENLTPQEEVEKMLILNAGHKSVSLRHQLELLFLNLMSYFKDIQEQGYSFKIIREKEIPSSSYSKKREVGQYHFAQLVSGILSFLTGEPTTTNTYLIDKLQKDDNDYNQYIGELSYEFFQDLIRFLLKLDEILKSRYGDRGVKWIARETVLVGLFSALGKYASENKSRKKEDVFNQFLEIINDDKVLNIEEYNDRRSSLDLSKVNIGTVTKNSVSKGVYSLLINKKPIEWSYFFEGDK